MNNVPAGWYPDSENESQLRYWDGIQWTEHRHPVQQQHAPQQYPQHQYVQQQFPQPAQHQQQFQQTQYSQYPNHAQPAKKSKTGLIIGLVAGGILLLGIIITVIVLLLRGATAIDAIPEPTLPTLPPTTETPTPEPTTTPPADEGSYAVEIGGPSDSDLLDPSSEWVTALSQKSGDDLGNRWTWVSEGTGITNYTSADPASESCTLEMINGYLLNFDESLAALTDDQAASSLLGNVWTGIPDETFVEYGVWYTREGIDETAFLTLNYDMLTLDIHTPDQTGYMVTRAFTNTGIGLISSVLCDSQEEAEVAFQRLIDFELVIMPYF